LVHLNQTSWIIRTGAAFFMDGSSVETGHHYTAEVAVEVAVAAATATARAGRLCGTHRLH
jgi:hypothetical protein